MSRFCHVMVFNADGGNPSRWRALFLDVLERITHITRNWSSPW